jgi:hypothetical protein
MSSLHFCQAIRTQRSLRAPKRTGPSQNDPYCYNLNTIAFMLVSFFSRFLIRIEVPAFPQCLRNCSETRCPRPAGYKAATWCVKNVTLPYRKCNGNVSHLPIYFGFVPVSFFPKPLSRQKNARSAAVCPHVFPVIRNTENLRFYSKPLFSTPPVESTARK